MRQSRIVQIWSTMYNTCHVVATQFLTCGTSQFVLLVSVGFSLQNMNVQKLWLTNNFHDRVCMFACMYFIWAVLSFISDFLTSFSCNHTCNNLTFYAIIWTWYFCFSSQAVEHVTLVNLILWPISSGMALK